MSAHPLSKGALRDIDSRVAKVLADLGNPEPPLSLDAVRELLRLDRHFYASGDHSALESVFHYARIGAKRVFEKPSRLLDAIQKLSLRAILVPEQRVIFLDESTPRAKHRWDEAHEIGHKLLEWHEDTLFGDTEFTLSRDCHEIIESEANYAAGRLLFLQDRFLRDLRDVGMGMKGAEVLRKRYQNSLTSTLWRLVELAEEPAFLLITQHPARPDEDAGDKPAIRYFVRSPSFAGGFACDSGTLLKTVAEHCSRARGGALADFETPLTDARGEESTFRVEVFYNKHDALTLGYRVRKGTIVVAF